MKRALLSFTLLASTASLARAQEPGADLTPPTPAPVAAPAPEAAPSAAPVAASVAEAALSAAEPGAPVPSPDPAAGAEPVLMSEAELGALGLSANIPAIDTSLQISGFADFTFKSLLASENSLVRLADSSFSHRSFYVGNFNLYISKNLTDSLRTMGEVRFSYMPNGSRPINDTLGEPMSTLIGDYSDTGRTFRWGGIQIERIYLEWTAHPLLTIRAGQYLTPYGVWNVDHGSPTYIPATRPFVIGSGWFPERQTGLEAFGRWDATLNSTIGYHLTVSNGTGPVSEYGDLDENKAVGGRLYWEYRKLGELRIGASGYYGRDTDAQRIAVVNGSDLSSGEKINAQYDQLSWAADFVWKVRGLHLQLEAITQQKEYTRRGRTIREGVTANLTGYPADTFSIGGYALVGYRFSWLGVMPFAVAEYADGELRGTATKRTVVHAGLNVRPVEMIALKLVYVHGIFLEGVLKDDPMRMIQAQVAWAF